MNAKTHLMNELIYLFQEWGDLLTEEESDLLKESIKVSQYEGLEYIGAEVWDALLKIYKRYENKNLEDYDYESEEV
jgi:hypothetical protein